MMAITKTTELLEQVLHSQRTMDRLIELGELSGQDPIQIVMYGLDEWVNANYHKLKQHYSD